MENLSLERTGEHGSGMCVHNMNSGFHIPGQRRMVEFYSACNF